MTTLSKTRERCRREKKTSERQVNNNDIVISMDLLRELSFDVSEPPPSLHRISLELDRSLDAASSVNNVSSNRRLQTDRARVESARRQMRRGHYTANQQYTGHAGSRALGDLGRSLDEVTFRTATPSKTTSGLHVHDFSGTDCVQDVHNTSKANTKPGRVFMNAQGSGNPPSSEVKFSPGSPGHTLSRPVPQIVANKCQPQKTPRGYGTPQGALYSGSYVAGRRSPCQASTQFKDYRANAVRFMEPKVLTMRRNPQLHRDRQQPDPLADYYRDNNMTASLPRLKTKSPPSAKASTRKYIVAWLEAGGAQPNFSRSQSSQKDTSLMIQNKR